MHILKSVGVMSVAKIMGLLYGCMGLLFAPFFLLFGLLGSLVGSGQDSLCRNFRRRCSLFSCPSSTVSWGLSWARLVLCCTTCSPNGWGDLNWKWRRRPPLPRHIR